jgi:glycosyltransferase involved in cell wall biosynthesis
LNILHYSLGLPPYRTGGLTKFCMDLMKEQEKEGDQVSLLWPGEIRIFCKHTKIKKNRSVEGITSFEVINPTPVSYDEGIVDIPEFTDQGDLKVYEQFLQLVRPDVIHIHTLMGLHKNLLVAAKRMGIKTVFTTHDFFPICPKVTMFRNDMICPDADTCENCPRCNMTALSLKKIQILQSPAYRALKDSMIVKKLRKGHRDEYLSGDEVIEGEPCRSAEDYRKLRKYYRRLLDLMDVVHYNSTVTKGVYEKYMGKRKNVLIPITHGDIQDHRKKKDFSYPLKLTYLGPLGGGKGFFRLKAVLDDLWKERQDFILNVFFHKEWLPPYIRQHDRYSYSQLESIMDETDVLITPSVWNETFGYTVMEALSYGVPVIVSSHVGAKDIVPVGAGIVFDDETGLKNAIQSLSKEKLESMNQTILESLQIQTMESFNKELRTNAY